MEQGKAELLMWCTQSDDGRNGGGRAGEGVSTAGSQVVESREIMFLRSLPRQGNYCQGIINAANRSQPSD